MEGKTPISGRASICRRTGNSLPDGPIANDTIFETLGIISSGFLKPAEALKLLLVGPEYTQVAIKTEKAASRLKWIQSVRIGQIETSRRKTEQEAYDVSFARILKEIIGEK